MSKKNTKARSYRGPSRPIDPRRAPGRQQPRRADTFGYTLVFIGVGLVIVLIVLASIFQGGSSTATSGTTAQQQAPVSNPAAATAAAATAVEQSFGTQIAGLPTISPSEALALYSAKNASFIDVRSKAQYDSSHITGAPNILYTDAQTRLGEFSKTGNLILYCQ